MRLNFLVKTVLSNLPLKQEKEKKTLQIEKNTRYIQIMTVASLEDKNLRMLVDLERETS